MTARPSDRDDGARLAAVIALVPGWSGRARVVRALSGGITNRNHVIDIDGERFVVRLPGRDSHLLEIDRDCEHVAATRAAELGIAPPVLGRFDGCLVTRFVVGAEIPDADFRQPSTLDAIAGILRLLHTSGPLAHGFDTFAVPRRHRDAAVSRGVVIPPEFERAMSVIDEIAAAFATSPDPPVPCHNDLLRANFLRDGLRLWLLDWEYAGMNDRAFDLGNLAVNNDLAPDAEEHLAAAYHGRATTRAVARLRLMKVVSDTREAMWAVVQQGISALDFDYRTYAARHFDRLLRNATAPAFTTWLADAATAG